SPITVTRRISPPRSGSRFSSKSATRCSTRTRKASSIGTLSHPTFSSPCTTVCHAVSADDRHTDLYVARTGGDERAGYRYTERHLQPRRPALRIARCETTVGSRDADAQGSG